MDLEAKTELKISKSPAEVFEAIVDPMKMAQYFITHGSGRMETGKSLQWSWGDVGAKATIEVGEVVAAKKISFRWGVTGRAATSVELTLEAAGEGTLVKVVERGWPRDEEGHARHAGQLGGWVNMLLCLKAFVQFGVNLRA